MKKNLAKSKKREDILAMLDHLIQYHGETMAIPMIRVDQQDGRILYTCCLSTGFLQAMICRLPRNLENPEGIQRALVTKKVSEIERHLSTERYGMPNAIVITLKCAGSRFLSLSPLDSRMGRDGAVSVLTVALQAFRDYLACCEVDADGYLTAPEKDLLGFMIDGHHRTEGAYVANKLDYLFSTSVYLDLDLRKMAEAFAGINCYQEKPSAIHTNAMRNLSGLMTEEENTAFSIMSDLNSQPGLFQEHIKMYDGPRESGLPRAYVNASKMQLLLRNWIDDNRTYGFRCNTLSQQEEAIQTYFAAWKTCYPDAWDNSKYVLTKAMGLDILFDLYGPLCNCLLREPLPEGGRPREEDFIRVIRRCFFQVEDENGTAVYRPKNIALDESGESVPLNWDSSLFGSLSSGKGIGLLKKLLRREIGNSH